MTTIGLIGAGHIGSQVARLAVAHGYDVVISNSRGPETLSALVAELGPRARAATAIEAAKAGDIVVVTVPLKNYRAVPVEPLPSGAGPSNPSRRVEPVTDEVLVNSPTTFALCFSSSNGKRFSSHARAMPSTPAAVPNRPA